MKMGKRILSLLCAVMVFSLAVTGVSAADKTSEAADAQQWIKPEYTDAVDTGSADNVVDLSGGSWKNADSEEIQLTNGGDLHASTDLVEVIVVMEEQPLIKRAAAFGMEGDMPAYMTMRSTVSTEQAMLRTHDSARAQIASLCGGRADTDGYDYTVVLNGFSMTMPYGKIAEAEELPGVKYIRESRTYNVPEDQTSYDLAMANSTGMIGSDVVNDMSFAGADGAGTLVAILDTGIAESHEAFSVEPKDLSAARYGTVSAMQAALNGAALSSGVTDAADAWISAKIPYAYNYASMTTGGYSTAQPHGTHAAGIVAGNEYTNAYYNQYGNNLGQADTPDNAAVASPSTSYSALSVASVNNAAVKSNYFKLGGADAADEDRIAFSQAVNASTGASLSIIDYLRTWSSDPSSNFPSFEYVVIGGIGADDDYAAAGITGATDLAGKFVLVNRGSTTFEEKATIAKNYGAKGVIFVNNAANAGKFAPAFNNYVLPSCGISLEDGEKLAAAENKTVTFGPTQGTYWYGDVPAEEQIPWVDTFPASDAYTMSDFSSWGPAPNLAIKPEISAPGGNIISSVIGGGYESYSGTSMATPHMAGAAALVRSYVKNVLGVTDAQALRDLTENLMMSTAVPGTNDSGAEFSPREQGAGLVNVENVVTTKAYLSTAANADGVTRPKAELGSSGTGAFSFTFDVNNLTDEALTYTLSASSLTEGITVQDGVKFSNQVSERLDESDFTVSCSGDTVNGGTVYVPAGGTAAVTVDIQLSASYMDELYRNFENGNYCEGYVYLQPTDGVTLVIPYLGLVGDWATAGVVFEGDMNSNFSLAPTQFATANVMGSGIYLGEDSTNDGSKSYNYDRLAFSPKIGGNQQYLAMQLGVRRNLLNFEASITSPDGEKVWSLGNDYLRKAFFYNGYGIYRSQIITDGWTGRLWNEETGAYDGDYAPAGQYYTLTLSGYAGQQTEVPSSVSYQLWLDGGAPEVSNLQCYTDGADGKFKLAFNVQDDHYVRMIELHDSTDSWALTYTAENFKDVEPQGSKSLVTVDLDELCQFLADNGLNPGRVKMYVYDYSMNYSVTYVDLGPQYLSLSNATVAVGDKLQMEYRVLPARLADTIKLDWTSSDESIATVDENGVVTGVAKGQCVITATAESGLSASANLTYMPISATEVQVTDYDEDTVFGEITIPETVTCEGDETVYTVTSVADKLFSQKYNITEVHLPDTITTVGERAFDQIHGLNYINIPKGLTALTGIQAFGYGGWDTLEAGEWLVDTLYVPAALATWNQCAFSGNKYTSAVLEDGLHMVGSYGLSNNAKLTDVKMASTVQFLKNNAFSSCEALESIELPEGLLYIGNQAFLADPLKSVDLPDSVKYVGTQAFESLKYDSSTVTYVGAPEIKLGSGVTGLGWNAFYRDAKLTAVLGSQQNLLVERCDFAETPDVVWDGRTNIPAGDWSRVPAGTVLEITGSVRIDGTLIIEDGAKVIVTRDGNLEIGMGATVDTSKITFIRVPSDPTTPVTPSTPTNPTTPEQPEFRFADVQDKNAYYYDSVYWAVENGITNGITATLFGPDGSCTRAQAVTFLWRAAGEPAPASTDMPFTDVPADAFYRTAVLWAVENGVTNGTSATTFSPDATCTRAQIVTFLWRSQKSPVVNYAMNFSDVDSGAFYAEAVRWAVSENVTAGTSATTFTPNATCTRAQIVTFLYRASK